MADRLRAQGAGVALREGLGSAVVFEALASGDIDAYVDYSGTLWTNTMQRSDNPPPARMLAEIASWMKEKRGVVVLGSLGFENAYALAMKRARARELGVASLDDLARRAPDLTLGADIEFLDRPEWRALQAAYGLRFKARKSYSPSFMYLALANGDADVISAFSSDGRVAADDLVTLDDPRHAVPSYDAIVLISPRRANDATLRRALEPLIGAISPQAMRAANYSVDRDADKREPAQAARELLTGIDAAK